MSSTRELALRQRRRLHEVVAGLTDAQWAAPSLCAGWTVGHVAAHVADSASTRLLPFLAGMAATRFDHDAYNRRAAGRWLRRPRADVERALAGDRVMTVFALAPALLLVDTVVHTQDIRRPLGLGVDLAPDVGAAVLTALVTSSGFAADARRVAGRTLVATDLDWRHGDGPELRAPGEELIMTICGRVPISVPG